MSSTDPDDAAPGDDTDPGPAGLGEDVCPECNGEGVIDGATCGYCEGRGKIMRKLAGA